METYIDLKKLNLDELVGVINLYPWFGAARAELCARMSCMGEGWSDAQFADAAMYVASRDKLAAIWRKARKGDWQDADVEHILKSYIDDKPKPELQETSTDDILASFQPKWLRPARLLQAEHDNQAQMLEVVASPSVRQE